MKSLKTWLARKAEEGKRINEVTGMLMAQNGWTSERARPIATAYVKATR